MSEEVTRESFEQIIEDATYLQDEAEALKYVIDTVPYEEAPPAEDSSILDKLLLLDHLQVNYYRPVFEKAETPARNHVKVQSYDAFCEDFAPETNNDIDIQKILSKLAKHRAALINVLQKIPLIDWQITIYKDNKEITLYHFARDMIYKDRSILKDIAEMVMVFQKEQQGRREIEQKISERNQHQNKN
jgi:hypothetical protein